ncbi:MAG: GTP-binding protein [Alphaproteobacteria bacterium]
MKSFTADTMQAAMGMVRETLGADAVIVATEPAADGKGIRLTAAVEPPEDDFPQDRLDGIEVAGQLQTLKRRLDFHAADPTLTETLLHAACNSGADDPAMALAAALDEVFAFQPLAPEHGGGRYLLIGPPGVGKTVTTAKLAARAVLAGHDVTVATTDGERAGGVDQLARLTRAMGIGLIVADTPAVLADRLPGDDHGLVLVDSAGIDPYDADAIATGEALAEAGGLEPVLVLAAGADPAEAADIVRALAPLGIRRLVATRLDIARRLGGVLTAAKAADLRFSDAGIAPEIADGLCPLTPVALARLLIRDPVAERAASNDLWATA